MPLNHVLVVKYTYNTQDRRNASFFSRYDYLQLLDIIGFSTVHDQGNSRINAIGVQVL